MASRLQTLSWFLRRPGLYPELFRLASDRLRGAGKPADTSAESIRWCSSIAIDVEEAVQRLTGARRASVDELFPDVWKGAQRTADECPVRMGGPGALALLYWLAEHVGATKVIETGVAYGWSSLALLLSLRNRPAARLISIDMPYPNLENDSYVGCVVPQDLRSQWRILRCADREGLPKVLREVGSLDLCHYDSDKSYAGRMWAYPLLWQALRTGGYLISDDINDNTAFRDFALQLRVEPIVIRFQGKHIGVIVRT